MGLLRPAALVVVLAALPFAAAASAKTTTRLAAEQRSAPTVPLAGIREHLRAFADIARRNGGNRAAGTPGYTASTEYVARHMRAAGYRVSFQPVTFPFVTDRSPPTLRTPGETPWRAGEDHATLAYSGSGRVEGPVVAVDLLVPSPRENASTSGCETADFTGFPRGAVVLLQRGTCTFRVKVENAIAAGASAAVVFNEGSPERRDLFSGTLGVPQARIPVLAVSFAVGETLRNGTREGRTGVTVELSADVIAQTRRTRNVIAESRTGNAANLVVVGAHLDGVRDGAGINDNASGSAMILEVAEQLARTKLRNRLRFVWRGAEELGLFGAQHYVSRLGAVARQRHALYLNFDMVGSPNYALFVYDGDGSTSGERGVTAPPGSAPIERVFARYFAARGLAYREIGMGGSDHLPFARAGIPVGGLFTGAGGRKSEADAAAFGGRAGQPYDPCYHRSCDTLANLSDTALTRVAQAAAHAIALLGRDVRSVRAAG
ncbi:MAG TPA: M20/M25/M40 family metallo-hydrolase [Gaiellaceae bacterium]|nr:M20/M25/M40 family metallo-hydrolase [Gaiellaceae bacterium]